MTCAMEAYHSARCCRGCTKYPMCFNRARRRADRIADAVARVAIRVLLIAGFVGGVATTVALGVLAILSFRGYVVLTSSYPPDSWTRDFGLLMQDGRLYCATVGEFGVSNLMMRKWPRGVHSTRVEPNLLHDVSTPDGWVYVGKTYATAPACLVAVPPIGLSLLCAWQWRRSQWRGGKRYVGRSRGSSTGAFPIDEVRCRENGSG